MLLKFHTEDVEDAVTTEVLPMAAEIA